MRFRIPQTKQMIEKEAIKWLVCLRGNPDETTKLRFRQWYARDVRHASIFDRVSVSFGLGKQQVPKEDGGRAISTNRSPAPRSSIAPALALAASFAALALGTFVFVSGTRLFGGPRELMLATRVGEIREIKLDDGSKLTLDTDTKVEVKIERSIRRAKIEHGRARFEIAETGIPFVVEAGREAVSATRGIIDVALGGGESRVDVLAGTSALSEVGATRAPDMVLEPGDDIVSRSGLPIERHRLADYPIWPRGMLQFAGTPLANAVALANTYSDQKIVLDGDFGQLKVTGAFRAGDSQRLARALAAAFKLAFYKSQDGKLHLAQPSLSQNSDRQAFR